MYFCNKKMKYPKSVFFIVSNEFCERFSYYGMRTVLSLYVMEILRYSEETSTVVFHTFTMLAYFFPLMGAIIADSWLGKYRTILYLSMVYVFGQLLLSASSTPWFHLPVREMSLLGLFLIALGTGGIKPCVTSFGGEQFKLPEQEVQLSSYFSVFYLSINCGALLSTFITPILRKDVTCFGLNTCYPLAFLIPSILMILSLVIFIAGKRMYKKKDPEGNIILKVTKCICHAIRRKISSSEKRKHWLDYADDAYDIKIIADTKSVLRVLRLFIPLPLFSALYDQQGSRWTFQATRMDGKVLGYLIKPDQFGVVNAVLVLMLLPLCQWIIYPVIERFFFINTPLRKLTIGGVLAATSFVISGLLELNLEPTYVVQPSAGLAQIRIFNTINCPADLSLDAQDYKLEAFGLYQNLSVSVTGNRSLNYDLNVTCPTVTPLKFTGTFFAKARRASEFSITDFVENINIKGSINVVEEKALSYLLRNDGLQISFSDTIEKSGSGDATVRALILTDKGTPANLSLRLDSSEHYQLKLHEDQFFTNFIEINHNMYNISINGVQIARDVSLKSGGVYTIVGRVSTDGRVQVKTVTVVDPNSVHMFWLLPQYIVISLGEIMFFVSGLEFAYTQAPASMKSLLQAIWLLNTAVGNLIVIVITEAHFFHRQVLEFFLFAGIMYVDMIIFAIMAMFYKYVDNSPIDNIKNEKLEMKKQNTNRETSSKIL